MFGNRTCGGSIYGRRVGRGQCLRTRAADAELVEPVADPVVDIPLDLVVVVKAVLLCQKVEKWLVLPCGPLLTLSLHLKADKI